MRLIENLKNLSKKDVLIAGGKGALLGELTKAGFLVPRGFVVLSNAFEKFLDKSDLDIKIDSILRVVNREKIHSVKKASEKIKSLILGEKISAEMAGEIRKSFRKLDSKFVAVRSSATVEDSANATWAGQLESFLNTTEKSLINNIKKCWASLYTSRAIFYRFKKNFQKQKISVAAVVQEMIESEASGTAFSVHPVTKNKGQVIIEAGYGLGEAIVSGQITPDRYIVSKNNRIIISKNIAEQKKAVVRSKNSGTLWKLIPHKKQKKPKLSDSEIRKLAKIVKKIEKHFNFPVDIEWAKEKSKIYILQCRPITTLKK